MKSLYDVASPPLFQYMSVKNARVSLSLMNFVQNLDLIDLVEKPEG